MKQGKYGNDRRKCPEVYIMHKLEFIRNTYIISM